jgi:hypothetical protein
MSRGMVLVFPQLASSSFHNWCQLLTRQGIMHNVPACLRFENEYVTTMVFLERYASGLLTAEENGKGDIDRT